MAKKAKSSSQPVQLSSKEVVRVTFRFHGPELEQVREVRDMLSLNAELDAARYLMQRGLEAMTPALLSRRSQTKMANAVSTENIVAALKAAGLDATKI